MGFLSSRDELKRESRLKGIKDANIVIPDSEVLLTIRDPTEFLLRDCFQFLATNLVHQSAALFTPILYLSLATWVFKVAKLNSSLNINRSCNSYPNLDQIPNIFYDLGVTARTRTSPQSISQSEEIVFNFKSQSINLKIVNQQVNKTIIYRSVIFCYKFSF